MRAGFLNPALLPTQSTPFPIYSLFFMCCPFRRAVGGWLDLLRRRPVTGGDVFDLQLVATMLANDVPRIYTFNGEDFEVFPELAVVTP